MQLEDYKTELEAYGKTLAYEIAFWMQGLSDPDVPFDEIGKLSLEMSDKLRDMAIIVLLIKGDSDRFYHNLIRSGMAREIYLVRCRDEGFLEDHHRASGRYKPLLDVVAAGDFHIARRIVALSPSAWQKGHEYEDDYCFAQILLRLVQEIPPQQEIRPLLERFETCLGDQPRTELEICRVLAKRDQEAFDKVFHALLDEHEADLAMSIKRGLREVTIAMRHLSVEGLAMLKLAEMVGLETRADYRYCPSLARVPMRSPFPGE